MGSASGWSGGAQTVGPRTRYRFTDRVVQGVPGIRASAGRKVVAVGDLAVPRMAQLAVAIADSFYGDGLDLSARENPVAGTWSEMPEVGAVQRLRDLHASDRQVRLFLTFVCAVDRARDGNRTRPV